MTRIEVGITVPSLSVLSVLSVVLSFGVGASVSAEEPPKGTLGHYGVLSGSTIATPPLATVDLLVMPAGREGVWWQLDARAKDEPGSEPVFQLQALTSRSPVARSDRPLDFHRYILRIAATGEVIEYRNVHTKKALLPPWRDVRRYFFPVPVPGCDFQEGMPETCTLLGHTLPLSTVKKNVPFKLFDGVKVLNLDPELLIGTSRNFKDKEGHRLPQKPQLQEYTYVPFTEADYKVMIEAGVNLFTIATDQEAFVRSEPVFYLRHPEGNPPMRLPADLYRGNYVGTDMFLDEPASIFGGEAQFNNKWLRHASDAIAVLKSRVHVQANDAGYGPFSLDREVRQQKLNLGDMRIEQYDMPVWETIYDTTFYQMAGGANGLVHEARYQLDWFDRTVAEKTGIQRKHTVDELLHYYFAFLRGGTRPYGKYWGTAIYGQCDPAIAPRTMTLAYDMGARYLWFWTSDHDHHMPWNEQVELTRTLRKHVAEHPRPSISSLGMVDLALVVPYGCFGSIEDFYGPRLPDKIPPYRRLIEKLHQAIHEAFDRKEDFDITVDDGREITGYRRVVRLELK